MDLICRSTVHHAAAAAVCQALQKVKLHFHVEMEQNMTNYTIKSPQTRVDIYK